MTPLQQNCPKCPQASTQPITLRCQIHPPILQHPPGTAAPQWCMEARGTQCPPLGTFLGGSTGRGRGSIKPALEHPAATGSLWLGPGCPDLLPLQGLAPCSWAFGSGTGLKAAMPEGWGLLRSLIPAYFSEV